MKREEIAAAQKLELDQLAEQEVAEMRREALHARERIDVAADALAAQMGIAPPSPQKVEPVLPITTPDAGGESATDAKSNAKPSAEPSQEAEADAASTDTAKIPKEAPNFADIAANIAGNDWKDL